MALVAPAVRTMTVAAEAASAATVRIARAVAASAATAQVARAVAASAAMVRTAVVAEADRPRLRAGLLHFERAGKHLFFVPDIPNWMVVNQNAALVLFGCDGSQTAESIAQQLDVPSESLEAVKSILSTAASRGVLQGLTHSVNHQFKRHDERAPSNAQARLRSVYIKLTDECNLRCKYCYAESGKPSEVMALDTLRRVLAEVSGISERVEIVLSGGEPLLHPHALDFAEEATVSGHSVQLLTNGILIDSQKTAQRVAACTSMVKISLDGSTEQLHSKTRGKGNFAQVTRAIDLLIKNGANIVVAMTVTRVNAHDIANMSARYGSRLALQPLFVAGRGKKRSKIALTGKEYYQAMAAVEGVAPMGNVAAVLEGIRGRGIKRCALAEREISISETGDVYPCQLLHAPEFWAGNIHSASVNDIYSNSPVLRKMRSISVDTVSKCSTCPIRLICAGGCRARDFYERGSVEDVGEFCEYEQLAFINGILDHSELVRC